MKENCKHSRVETQVVRMRGNDGRYIGDGYYLECFNCNKAFKPQELVDRCIELEKLAGDARTLVNFCIRNYSYCPMVVADKAYEMDTIWFSGKKE